MNHCYKMNYLIISSSYGNGVRCGFYLDLVVGKMCI